MKDEKGMSKCKICNNKPCVDSSDLWCTGCYVDFAIAHNVFGTDAVNEFKKRNK